MKVTFGEIDLDIRQVTILDQPVRETMVQANYDYLDPDILNGEGLIRNPGTRYMAIWHPNIEISYTDILKVITLMKTVIGGEIYTGRPATFEELAACEVSFYEEFVDQVVEAIGEKITIKREVWVACCYGGESNRHLCSRIWRDSDKKVPKDFRLLIVFEKVGK